MNAGRSSRTNSTKLKTTKKTPPLHRRGIFRPNHFHKEGIYSQAGTRRRHRIYYKYTSSPRHAPITTSDTPKYSQNSCKLLVLDRSSSSLRRPVHQGRQFTATRSFLRALAQDISRTLQQCHMRMLCCRLLAKDMTEFTIYTTNGGGATGSNVS